MLSKKTLPSLEGWNETKKALHAYAKVAGAPARVLAEPHPKWWHVSLKITDDGLVSDVLSNAESGENELSTMLNLRSHTLDLLVDGQPSKSFDLTSGDSATALGIKLQSALTELGVTLELPEEKYADVSPTNYDPDAAQRYLTAVNIIVEAMQTVRANLEGDRSPIQLWPHHFDLAFEWFGTKVTTYKENGEDVDYPAQLNFGFAPGDSSYPEPYFYSNPWPLDESLTDQPLPHAAHWYSQGFNGTLLPYEDIQGDPDAGSKLVEYYRKVFELAKPTLMA